MKVSTSKKDEELLIATDKADTNRVPSDDPESARKKAMLLDMFIREIDLGIGNPESAGHTLYTRYKAIFPNH